MLTPSYRQFTDHVADVNAERPLGAVSREDQQCTAQMVEWAKQHLDRGRSPRDAGTSQAGGDFGGQRALDTTARRVDLG